MRTPKEDWKRLIIPDVCFLVGEVRLSSVLLPPAQVRIAGTGTCPSVPHCPRTGGLEIGALHCGPSPQV